MGEISRTSCLIFILCATSIDRTTSAENANTESRDKRVFLDGRPTLSPKDPVVLKGDSLVLTCKLPNGNNETDFDFHLECNNIAIGGVKTRSSYANFKIERVTLKHAGNCSCSIRLIGIIASTRLTVISAGDAITVVEKGQDVTLRALQDGVSTPGLIYRWYKDNESVHKSERNDGPTLKIIKANTTDAKGYNCVVVSEDAYRYYGSLEEVDEKAKVNIYQELAVFYVSKRINKSSVECSLILNTLRPMVINWLKDGEEIHPGPNSSIRILNRTISRANFSNVDDSTSITVQIIHQGQILMSKNFTIHANSTSNQSSLSDPDKSVKGYTIGITVPLATVAVVAALLLFVYCKRRRRLNGGYDVVSRQGTTSDGENMERRSTDMNESSSPLVGDKDSEMGDSEKEHLGDDKNTRNGVSEKMTTTV